MASTLDDDDLSLSIPSASARRNSARAVNRDATRANDGNNANNENNNNNNNRQTGRPNGHGRLPGQPPGSRQDPASQRTLQRLGQYTVVKTLGEGSFGKVKLAVHQVSGQKVALKIISRRKLITRDMAGRIEREIQYLQLLRHPHIIKLYTVITNATDIIMVLEYAGGELFDFLVQHGRMPEDRARKFFQQIVCAVEYCHRHKIVHRDLKPENLLLDEKLNVKIADFGLSNIMTDGNFLKTSCGSPNYAAPEVISGKLYAGPEVDVWSCGVILYVLLVGRLPFDDEFIPALFKKIAQGNYTIPNYVSPGAVRLIKKILVINPMNRITVAEIRQDPWFTKDLAPYLQVQPDDIFESGADPNKAIDPRGLAASKPPEFAEKLHSSAIGKLGKTMGYPEVDVLEALAKSEPSAIKDAYLIVRENQMMKENPLLYKEADYEHLFAQSPPSFMGQTPPISSLTSSRPPQLQERPAAPATMEQFRSGSGRDAVSTSTEIQTPTNTVAVLPSSLPAFHAAYIEGQPVRAAGSDEATPQDRADANVGETTNEEMAANYRRLRPSTRSSADRAGNKPEAMTPLPKKKSKPTKWQFGIRSKTHPVEAMSAIYGALKDLGAEWEVPRYKKQSRPNSPNGGSSSQSGVNSTGGSGSNSHSDERSSGSRSRSQSRSRSRSRSHDRRARDANVNAHGNAAGSGGRRQSGHADRTNDDRTPRGRDRGERSRRKRREQLKYKLPEDPWVINARLRKGGMYPPGAMSPSSAHSSRADLQEEVLSRRRSSTNAGQNQGQGLGLGQIDGNANASATGAVDGGSASFTGPSAPASASHGLAGGGVLIGSEQRMTPIVGKDAQAKGKKGRFAAEADEAAYVYMTIQLYTIEPDFYLVDFKCAGYERLVREVVREVREVRELVTAPAAAATAAAGTTGDSSSASSSLPPPSRPLEVSSSSASASAAATNVSAAGTGTGSCTSGDSSDAVQHPSQEYHWRILAEDETVVDELAQVRVREREVGLGRAEGEKLATSPFPFLDVTSRLITHLAQNA